MHGLNTLQLFAALGIATYINKYIHKYIIINILQIIDYNNHEIKLVFYILVLGVSVICAQGAKLYPYSYPPPFFFLLFESLIS